MLQVDPSALEAQSEGAVRGQVVAAADGSALVGAVVTLTRATRDPAQGRTEAEGHFGFANVRPGGYVLSESCEGFRSRDFRFVLEPRETRTITAALAVASVAVRIDVAGSLAPLPGTHSPSSTTLTTERLDGMPCFQRLTLSDAVVTLAPGTVCGHDASVHIRGHKRARIRSSTACPSGKTHMRCSRRG